MNEDDKAASYDQFLSEYHRLENEIGQIKMNKFDLDAEETNQINLLERKKEYIMSRVEELSK